MPKPNKYNIKAIRNELVNCIRYKSWNKFRTVFEPLELDLQTAVAKEQTGKNRQFSSPPLLCVLLEGIKRSSSVPQIDLFEVILKACPISSKNRTLQFYGNTNPLSIAIDRHAPIGIVELILKHDERNELLYPTKKQAREPPILKLARCQSQDSQASNREELLRLLVANDVTKQSLLIPSASKKKVALYYASSDCISSLPLRVSSDGNNRDIRVEEIVGFMLLETQQAVDIQQGRRKPVADQPIGSVDRNDDDNNVGFFSNSVNLLSSGSSNKSTQETDDDESTHDQSSNIRAMELLRAMVTCAHLLGSRKTIDLMQHLVYRTHDLTRVDDQGDSLLHYICRATETLAFLNQCLADDERPSKRDLVQHLIAECPNILVQRNDNGDIPLHVAIRFGKPWELLCHLCPPTYYAATILGTPTKQNQLPLHLAIEYPLSKLCIDGLWRLFPEAATIMDGKHHLFPFQLIAAFGSNNGTAKFGGGSRRQPIVQQLACINDGASMNNEPEDVSFFELQLSYNLLRSAPEVLQHFK